jgi:predicted nucleic acid-binding protein
VYAELSLAFSSIEELEREVERLELSVVEVPRPALFLAGKAFTKYKRRDGRRVNVLPDFFIGAHAAVAAMPLLTRGAARYRNYFPTVQLISP